MQLTLALNQRWCDGRASYRPPAEPIRTAEYDVAEIPDDTTARQFITQHHYSHTYPAARFRAGLYRHGELAGVAVFSHPCSNAVLTNVFDAPVLTTVELGRFVLLDSVAGNGETWFLARSFEILRKHAIVGVVSFSDPLQRRTESGEVIHMGHVGTIYQAHNGTYLGRGTARTLHRSGSTKKGTSLGIWQASGRTLIRSHLERRKRPLRKRSGANSSPCNGSRDCVIRGHSRAPTASLTQRPLRLRLIYASRGASYIICYLAILC